ncbi:TAXI family TRAP transporter solute-binding subunit [Pseudodesulfovibrio sp. zrk46]|nr:TAXI family TRAP transporter solute-binding subunit [Pseudodesulfovibrio sp. zrk46]
MRFIMACLTVLVLLLSLGCSSEPEQAPPSVEQAEQKRVLAFGGGPTGGTFNFFANKMASIISKQYEWLDVSPRGSGGSAENLRTLNKNGLDLAIVYSGDAYLGRNGKLPGDKARYEDVRALSFLYGAPAQLVVRKDSDIQSPMDLVDRVVAVGNPGSGAALSAERFFRHIGMWDKIKTRNLGYSRAASELVSRKIDAFWVLVGYPNSSIIEAASHLPIRLIGLHQVSLKTGFYDVYPFYSMVEIPANTYDGQERKVMTFQDSSLWCASVKMPEEVVYDCLRAIYSEHGLEDMVMAHKAAKGMSKASGILGVSIPLHPGALRFWQGQGLDIPAHLMP